jgi:hypothetical protein
METPERDAILNEESKFKEAFNDLLFDAEHTILTTFETCPKEDAVYFQGQYALVKWLQRYIASTQASLDYLKADLAEDGS